MIQANQITMVLDGVTTPIHNPVFGVSHQSAPGTSFEDIVDAGTLSCLTITAENSGSTRASVEAANKVKFVVTKDSGNVDLNGTVHQVSDAFGGSHYSIVFLVS